ncbi:hypothetical protein OAK07_01585 [Marine Group III euryarchaeote]|nr:hypothetical protein [Marine Group III euryarchaeote]
MEKRHLDYEEYERLREEYFRKKGRKDPIKEKRKNRLKKENKKTVSQLKLELKERKMPTGGTKADLIDRLKRADVVDSVKNVKPKKKVSKTKEYAKPLHSKKGLFCPLCKGSVVKRHKGLSTEYGFCNSCDRGFVIPEVKNKEGRKYYFCEDCNYQTTSLATYSNHLTTRKHLVNANRQEESICKMCGFMMQNSDDYFCCESCGLTKLKLTHRITSWTELKKEVWERDGGKCIKCGSLQNLEVKKIISLAKGGKNTLLNLKLICNICKN